MVSAAEIDIEPFYAESEVRAAFDEHAVAYRVEWVRRNRIQKLFTRPPDPDALIRLIEAHPTAPDAEEELAAVVTRLRANRAASRIVQHRK